jgi:NAD(P)H-nitrite reductase large subunit
MRPRERLVVVGHGMAGTRLVEELVRRGAGYEITVIGDEPDPGYNRVLLSAVVGGSHGVDDVLLRDASWYAERGVRVARGRRVTEVDRERRQVLLGDGTAHPYDRLVLATGSRAVLPPVRGLVTPEGLHPAVHAFRSLEDCRRLDVEAVPGRRAVVVGGGLLGLQVARALTVRGLDVEIVEVGESLMGRQLGPAAARVLERDVRRLGTEVYTGARAVGFSERGLRLDNGHVLSTDLVVLACGSRPATRLAKRAGLMVRRGIVVDDGLRSVSDPSVYAIGDCVEHRGTVHGLVGPAWEQATVLAARLAGEPVGYSGSRVVARLRAPGLELAVLGQSAAAAGDVVEVSNPLRGSYRRIVLRDGVVEAAVLLGDLSRIGVLTQHYDRQTVLGPADASWLLVGDVPAGGPAGVPDEAEICACAGVTAGRIRACADLAAVVADTRATTGCGGCVDTVAGLVGRSRHDPVALAAAG